MATTLFRGHEVHTVGELPAIGSTAPSYTLTARDFSDLSSDDFRGQRVVLNIFPTIDTGVCSASVRRFNELAAGLENTRVVCVSMDLPLSLNRFCGAEGIDDVAVGSAFRSSFGTDYGVTLTEGAWSGLLARSVVVYDADGKVLHTQLVGDIGQEPDYDAAVAAVG